MKLSKITESILNDIFNNVTLEQQEDNTWKATYYKFNGKTNKRTTKYYKNLKIDIVLIPGKNFELFSGYWENNDYIRNTTDGTFYVDNSEKRYINLYFKKNF